MDKEITPGPGLQKKPPERLEKAPGRAVMVAVAHCSADAGAPRGRNSATITGARIWPMTQSPNGCMN